MRRAFLLYGLCVASVACVSTVAQHRFGYEAWRQGILERGVDPDVAVYPYRISPEMRAWAEEFRARYPVLPPQDRLKRLQDALFSPREFPFTYDERLTLTAADAFAERRGNCMAFTALFIALSRAMGDDTFLVAVRRAPEVEREESLVVINRHVVAGYNNSGHMHLYDFYISSQLPYISRRVIDDVKATAIYHTNLGGAAIRSGDLAEADRQLRLASRIDPELGAAWINLGVVRSRLGDDDGAMAAYERALEVEPESSSAWTNMAFLYSSQGMEDEARNALLAATQGRSTAFTLIALADAELAQGDADQARRHLIRAKRQFPGEPAVFAALARVERLAGDLEAAERYQRRADKLAGRP